MFYFPPFLSDLKKPLPSEIPDATQLKETSRKYKLINKVEPDYTCYNMFIKDMKEKAKEGYTSVSYSLPKNTIFYHCTFLVPTFFESYNLKRKGYKLLTSKDNIHDGNNVHNYKISWNDA